jgi:hypothetical protein
MDDHRRRLYIFHLLMITLGTALACQTNHDSQRPEVAQKHELKLFDSVPQRQDQAQATDVALTIIPGDQEEAEAYYKEIRKALGGFPRTTLAESSIGDMLSYYGYPALLSKDLESLAPSVIMDFERLRKAVSNTTEFDSVYGTRPLEPGEILVARFFAPKIINVRDPQVNGVPQGGFGWRKILRFRAREGSPARTDKLDSFYLLFNFTSNNPEFPGGVHAGQIQAILVPIYPSTGKHRDAYFLVYESLGATANPEKVGFFLRATFDLAGVVPDDKYFVPRACGQCHGTELDDQKGAKVNYLDTDHWFDRTRDDFTQVPAANVLVDGTSSYTFFRQLNTRIAEQNEAVIKQSGGPQFGLLAAQKWLELHQQGKLGADQPVPPLLRGFVEKAGDAVWTERASPDQELLPLMNQFCFRCHSSVRYHVFQKQTVLSLKTKIKARVKSGNMPQDRKLNQGQINQIVDLVDKLK